MSNGLDQHLTTITNEGRHRFADGLDKPIRLVALLGNDTAAVIANVGLLGTCDADSGPFAIKWS